MIRLQRFGPVTALAFAGLLVSERFWELAGNGPYVLLVECLAVVYGWQQGLTAALVVLLAQGLMGEVSASLAVQLLLRALLFGLLSEGLRQRNAHVRRQMLQQAASLARLQEAEQVYLEANGELKDELTRLKQEREPLLRVAQRLLVLTRQEEVAGELALVAAEALGAEACSFYMVEGKELRLASSCGGSPPRSLADGSEDLAVWAARGKRLQSIRGLPAEFFEQARMPAVRVLATPVLHPEGGHVLGVLCVDHLRFERLTRSTTALLESIAALAGKSLAQATAARVSGHEREQWQDWLGPADLMRRIRRASVALHEGAGAPFCLLGLRVSSSLPPEILARCDRALYLIGRANLRAPDLGGREIPGSLVFVLAKANLAELHDVSRALALQVSEFLPRWVPEAANPSVLLALNAGRPDSSPEEMLTELWRKARPCHLLS